MIDLAIDLGQKSAALPDEVGFNFQPERQVAAMASFGNLPESIRRYWERERPIELRPVDMSRYISPKVREPKQAIC